MATIITSECINCGACEPECPNTAIYQGGVEWEAPAGDMRAAISDEVFYIVPEKCTECVGFHEQEACAAVCPVDCCVPDPNIPETHDVLLARARELHPDKTIPDDAPSRFKAGGVGGAAAATPAATPAAGAAAAPVAAAAPAVRAGSGRVEKAGAAPRAKREDRIFAGELPGDFEQIIASLGAPRRRLRSLLARGALGALAAAQGILGALGGARLRALEAAIGDTRFFKAELAMAANVFLNLLLYPVLAGALAVSLDRADVFNQDMRWWVCIGLLVGFAEAGWRLGDNFFHGVPFADVKLRGAPYGLAVLPLGILVQALAGSRGSRSSVGFDGFYHGDEPFDEKLERPRRYGDVYHLEERDDAYLLRVEFPRHVPPTSLAGDLQLPSEMPDYDFDLGIRGSQFEVHGRVTDPAVRKLTGAAPAFPGEFTTRIPLGGPVQGFRHRYRDKTLEVVLPKATE